MKKSERQRFREVEARLGQISGNLTEKDERLVRVKFVGVTFEPDTYSNGEDQLNEALDHGYRVMREYPTGAGVVIALGLYKNGAV
ncbi:MAG: hypothetical protein H8E89_11400 [Candidatus Nitrosopelagicus sp.]|jgi:hypothetical protein|nr:hypothetical protein [Candidatus Nitrosopelagicus sp.]